jgi:rhamnosyltransferase
MIMKITLIIPTLNAGHCLGNLLSGLREQDTAPVEIIIIDSSSEDNTVRIAESFGGKTIVVPRKSFNHGKTRNVAAREAKGDVLAFMTQDALPFDNSLLRVLTAPLGQPDIAATFGRQIPKPDAPLPEVFARAFNYPDVPSVKGISDTGEYGIKTFFFSNVCSAIKRDLFFKAGMFPENIRLNEDMLLAAKFMISGYKVSYVPEAKVFHSHNFSLLNQFRRYYNIAASLRRNSWILEYARPEGEGIRFMKEQASFLLKHRGYRWIPYVFLDSLAKYAGYRMGLLRG